MIRVSVIIPGFQAEAYAEACLEGLLAQCGGEAEVLCVNDGSTDGTGALLDRFAAQDGRVRVWHTENKGVSAARNLALSYAKGDYVAFVDMDDQLPEGAIAKLCAAAKGADIVVGDYERVDAAGRAQRVRLPETVTRQDALHSILSGEGSYNAPWAKLYRHDFLWEHALAFSQNLRIGEDALFNLRAFDLAERIARVPEVVYLYTERPGSAMAGAAQDRYDWHVPMLQEMDAYLRKTKQKEAYYRDFLQLHAALLRAQYGPGAGQAFARLAVPRTQQGVDPRKLRGSVRLLYHAVALGHGNLVYRRLMRGVH